MRSDARIAAIVVVATAATVLVGTAAPARAQQPEAALLNGLDRDVACAPASPLVRPATPLTVIAGRDRDKTSSPSATRSSSAAAPRRASRRATSSSSGGWSTTSPPRSSPASIRSASHAAGAVQMVEAQADASVAVVTYSCDTITEGDYLERYQRSGHCRRRRSGTTPDFAHPGRLILGAERRQMGTPGNFMVDRPWQRPRPASRAADHIFRRDRR